MAKFVPLAEITSVAGDIVVFDPARVSIVHVMPRRIDGSPGRLPMPDGPMTTHIWGITDGPQPVAQPPEGVLSTFKIEKKFVMLTTYLGPVWIRASSISWLVSHYPGETDPRAKCFIKVGSNKELWHIIEDLPTARKMIDVVRAADAATLV
jgi:hypothetical protein